MKIIFSFITSAMIVILSSCSEDSFDLSTKMKDGNTITLRNDNVIHYDTQEEFQKGLSFVFSMSYSFLANNHVCLVPDSTVCIIGYDDRYIGLWEKASFGNWIEKYGLQPNKSYYVASCIYVIYLPLPPNGYYLFPIACNYGSIGLVPPLGNTGAIVSYNKSIGLSICKSGSRYIGYDENGNLIAQEIPQLKNYITWNFFIKRNGWD